MHRPPRAGFSLAAILLLTIFAAVLLAAARTVMVHEGLRGPDDGGLRAVVGGMIGLFVGLAIGLSQPRPLHATLLGVFVGVLVGAPGGVLLAAPANLPLAVIGSLILVLFGVVVRAFSHRPPDG